MPIGYYDCGMTVLLKSKSARKPKGKRGGAEPAEEKYVSRAVSKALEALSMLQADGDGRTMNTIAQRLDISKTMAFRILRTLEVTGHVVPDGRGVYKLTPASHAIGPAQWVGNLVRMGVPHLRALSHELEETATLAVLFENRVEVVSVVESAHDVRMSNAVGHIVPPNASSLGKVITAFQPAEQQEKLLRSFKIYRFTDGTITDRKLLSREYEQIRAQGFAVDREECATGGVCFSVPVLAANGHAPAAVSVSMPKTRLRGAEQEEHIVATLRATASLLASELNLN